MIIRIKDLRYTYPHSAAGQGHVLDGINLTVGEGEFLAIMGPSGAGKTTLCLALNGIIPHALGGKYGGHVFVNGQDIRGRSIAEMAQVVAMVFQNPEGQLFMATVEQEVAFGPENLGLERDEIRRRVDAALQVVGMSAMAQRSPQSLSGGEMQRVAIAAALSLEPRILVLDEPTANLDPLGQQEVLQAIDALRQRLGTAVIMVSQNSEWVAEFSERTAILTQGRIAAVGPTPEILADKALLDSAQLTAPQVTQIARGLNQMMGTRYAFCRYRETLSALSRNGGSA